MKAGKFFALLPLFVSINSITMMKLPFLHNAVRKHARINFMKDTLRVNRLFKAVHRSDRDHVREVYSCLVQGADPNAVRKVHEIDRHSHSNLESTLLHQALRSGKTWSYGEDRWFTHPQGNHHEAVVRLLLMWGACPNTRNWDQSLPLERVASNQDSMRLLIEHDACIFSNNKDQKPLLHTDLDLGIPLDDLHARGLLAVALKERDENGNTPFHAAAQALCDNTSTQQIRLLYRYGADPLRENNDGKTARDLVDSTRCQEMLELMELKKDQREKLDESRCKEAELFNVAWRQLEKGKFLKMLLCEHPDLVMGARNIHGTTLLHWAVRKQRYEIVERLMPCLKPIDAPDDNHYVDINKIDAQGLTPLHWALHGDDHAIIHKLLDNGAAADEKAFEIAELFGNVQGLKLLWAYKSGRIDLREEGDYGL